MSIEVRKKIVNTRGAADYLGVVSPRTLEEWRRLSVPKGPKWIDIEGKIGYRISDLEAYLESRVREPGDDFAA